MPDFPAELSTGMVHGRFIVAIIDSEDEGQEPDVIPAQGKVAFKASVGYIPVPVATGGPVTVMKGPIIGVLDDDGYLCTPHPTTGDPMYRGVRLIATDDPDMAVTDWTWGVDYQLEAVNGNPMQIPAHSFALPSGSELDLTTLVKVPSSPGYGLPQAEAAVNETITGATVVGDDLVMTRRNGGAFTAGNVRGATGGTGPKGDPGPSGVSNTDQFYQVSQVAGRTVSVWDYLNSRYQLIYGDTGERDISSLLVNAAGVARLQRTGGTVHLYLQSIKPAITGSGVFLNLPSGFRPSTQRAFQLNVSTAGSFYRSAYMFTSGGVGAWLQDPTDSYSFTYSFPTVSPWPTTLPGVAA